MNDVVLDAYVVAADRNLRILRPFTGPHVVTPPMPRADDEITIHRPFSQRAAGMRARIIDGMHCSANIANGHTDSIYFD
jgi:hypothetical protein